MSDDLVKQLRFTADDVCRCGTPVCLEAADRIEKLETALKHCINAIRQYEMGDDRPRGPAGPVRPWLLGAMDNAIKVLEGKDD
jgi:hypothetical protein